MTNPGRLPVARWPLGSEHWALIGHWSFGIDRAGGPNQYGAAFWFMRHVYLDHQTTTPVLPEVFEAMAPFFTKSFGSPSSLHRQGLAARDALAKARAQMAALIHAESADDI